MNGEFCCPKCGKPIEEGSAFCPHCGFRMNRRKWPWKKIIPVAALLVVLGVAGAVLASGLRMVPSVVGMTQMEAISYLNEKGFQAQPVCELTKDTEENLVYGQSPSGFCLPGKKEEPVTLYVSAGIAVQCPDVRGMTEQQAKEALEAVGLSYTVTKQYTADTEEGIVCGQNKSGEVKKGSHIGLTVSQGAGKTAASQVGKDPQEAEANLRANGFNVVIEEYGNGADVFAEKQTVISQDKQGVQPDGETITLELDRPSLQIPRISTSSDSLGGVEMEMVLKNVSDKDIKYVDFDISFYDPFGEPANCEIRGTNTYSVRYVGPLRPGESETVQSTERVVYNPSVAAWFPTKILVTFVDDTTQELTCSQFWHTDEYAGDGTFDW